MTDPCDVCEQVAAMDTGGDPYAVARTETGYVRLATTQYHEGYTLFMAKQCVPELNDLAAPVRTRFLEEMALVAETVFRGAFTPQKLNYELLGNSCAHLHWHLFPRHADDPHPRGPVWEDLEFLRTRWTNGAVPDAARLAFLKQRLLAALEDTDLTLEQRFV